MFLSRNVISLFLWIVFSSNANGETHGWPISPVKACSLFFLRDWLWKYLNRFHFDHRIHLWSYNLWKILLSSYFVGSAEKFLKGRTMCFRRMNEDYIGRKQRVLGKKKNHVDFVGLYYQVCIVLFVFELQNSNGNVVIVRLRYVFFWISNTGVHYFTTDTESRAQKRYIRTSTKIELWGPKHHIQNRPQKKKIKD